MFSEAAIRPSSVVEILWRGKVYAFKQLVIHRIRAPITMRSFELIQQHEWLVTIPLFGQPLDAVVFNHLGGVPVSSTKVSTPLTQN